MRKLVVSVETAAELGVCVPVVPVPAPGLVREEPSSLEGSGVPGRLFCELNVGLRSDVSDGLGGNGVGGRL